MYTSGWVLGLFIWNYYNIVRHGLVKPCLTLCDPVDCSPPGSSVCGILQAGILEWVVVFFSTPIQNKNFKFGKKNLRGLEWEWASFLRQNARLFFNLLYSQPSLPPFSAASFLPLSLHLMPVTAQSALPGGCAPQGMRDFWGLSPTDTPHSRRPGLPGAAALGDAGPWQQGLPRALIDGPEHSDSIWQEASVIWRNSQERFAPSWVSPSAVCSCQLLVLHSLPRGRLEMLTHTLQTKTGLVLCLRY